MGILGRSVTIDLVKIVVSRGSTHCNHNDLNLIVARKVNVTCVGDASP